MWRCQSPKSVGGGLCVCTGCSAERATVPLACDVDALAIEDKGNKNPTRSQCLRSAGLVGGELCPNVHISAQKAWANISEAKLDS